MPRPRKPKPVALNTVHPHDLMTVCPSGWSTVANWWATEEQAYLSLLDDPAATMIEDDQRLQKFYEISNMPLVLVDACRLLQRKGIALERAYPTVELARHYPSAPRPY